MSRTIAELAALVGGQLLRGRGDGVVSRVMPIDGATADSVSFITNKTVANGVQVKLSPNGEICVKASKPTHIVIDVTGWWN